MKGKVLGKATQLVLSEEQHAKLPSLAVGQGGYQTVFARIRDNVKKVNGNLVATVYTNDLEKLREWAQRPDEGTWQDWARSVLTKNGQLEAPEKK